ncbi:MAG: ankyrin repeat domain-containing protein, partial [Oligoflexia bacterium]|nr:ankyrin repeat domain-containing protein [Oligoflexia bacterium]
LVYADRCREEELMDLLSSPQLEPNKWVYDMTAIREALLKNNKKQSIELVLKQRELSPLMFMVAMSRSKREIHELVERGAMVNGMTKRLRLTPLFVAIQKGSNELVKQLLYDGANINIRLAAGNKPYDPDYENFNLKDWPQNALPLEIAVNSSISLELVRQLVPREYDRFQDRDGFNRSELTRLMRLAFASGRYDIAGMFIELGADIKTSGINGNTPLMKAILSARDIYDHRLLQSSVNELELLVNEFVSRYSLGMLNKKNNKGRTAIGMSRRKGYAKVTAILHDAGAGKKEEQVLADKEKFFKDPDVCKWPLGKIRTFYRRKVDLNTKLEELKKALKCGKYDVASMFLDMGADFRHVDQKTGKTLLVTALSTAGSYNYLLDDFVNELLVRYRYPGSELLDKPDHKGFNALMLSIDKGFSNISAKLINAGADVNMPDNNGETPLMKACKKMSIAVFKKLLDNGADPDAKDRKGNAVLHYFAKSGFDNFVKKVSENIAVLSMKELLVAMIYANAELDIRDSEGNSPLILAFDNRQKETAGLLADEQTYKDAVNNSGRSVLLAAIENYNISTDIVRIIRLIAENADPNVQDQRGMTPLIAAAMIDNSDISNSLACILLDEGADPCANGKTNVFVEAARRGNIELITRLLLDYNADPGLKTDNGETAYSVAAINGYYELMDLLEVFGGIP